jgi:ABC-type uncharacterized transport system substrate-binding protein
MAGASQGDRTEREARGVPSNSRYSGWAWPIRRDAGLSTLVWGGGTPIIVRDAGEIERAVTALAGATNGGLIVAGGVGPSVHRDAIIKLTAQHSLPTLYSDPAFVVEGGLIAYGPERVEQYRSAAGYVDRILRGEKPADLPVQAPTKYELVINLKTAKALSLDVPATLLARANEVIE